MKKFLKWWRRENSHKYVNGGRGVISILLVVIMLPFVSIADLLVESARYHSAVTVLDEAMDSSNLSVLADYDEYLYKRFGLLAVDNDTDISSEYQKYLKKNTESLYAWGLGEISAQGKYALTDNDILTKQIAEFSQYSAPAALVNDLGLSELISTLENMTKMTDVFEIVSGVGSTTSALLDVSKSLEELKGKAQAVENAKTDYDAKYNAFEAAYNQLVSAVNVYNQKNENVKAVEKKVNEFDKAAEINNRIENVENELKELEKRKANNEITEEEYEETKKTKEDKLAALEDELEKALAEQNDLLEELQTAKNELSSAENDVAAKRTSLSNAKIEYSTSIDTLIGCWGEYQTKADEVLEDAESCITSAVSLGTKVTETSAKNEMKQEELKQQKEDLIAKQNSTSDPELKKEYQTSIDKIDNQIDDFEAGGDTASASGKAVKDEIENYANLIQDNMKQYDKEKIQNYVEELKKVQTRLAQLNVESVSPKNVLDKKIYYVVIEDGFLTSTGIQMLMDSLENKVSNGSLWDLLDGLGTILRSLFTTDLFFDARLTSYIAENAGYSPGEIDLILNDFSTLINLLVGSGSGILGLVNVVTHIKEVVDTIVSLGNHVLNYLQGMITRAITAVKEILSNQCGKKILLDEYMIKSLSDRTDINNSGEIGGKNVLTGYSFKDVKYAKHNNQVPVIGEINALIDLFKSIKDGGNDLMFSGAEIEYILVGSRSEAINQVVVFFQIYFARFLIDSCQILADSEVRSIASATGPIGAVVVYILYMFIEPLIDTILIVNNEDISLLHKVVYITPSGVGTLIGRLTQMGIKSEQKEKIKNKAYKIAGIKGVAGADSDDSQGITWKYENYLFLLMLISIDNETAVNRFRNIMSLEAKAYYGQEQFDVKKTYTCIEGTVSGKFDPILPLGGIAVNGLFDQKRNRMRGY